MVPRVLFIANAIVSLSFGVGSVLAPNLLLSLFGARPEPAGALMMQYGGAWLVGLGLLTWLTRDAAGSETGRHIARSLLAAYFVALLVALRGQLAGVLNLLGWLPVAMQAFFVAGFSYWLLAGRRADAPGAAQA